MDLLQPVEELSTGEPWIGGETCPDAEGERRDGPSRFVFAAFWFTSTAMAAHLPRLPEAAAVAAAALVGPAQVAGRLAEFGAMRRLHPLFSARLAALAHPRGAGLLLAVGAPGAAAFTALHGAGNGIMTIARGTLPLALFGPRARAPARLARGAGRIAAVFAPIASSILIDRLGAGASWVTAGSALPASGRFSSCAPRRRRRRARESRPAEGGMRRERRARRQRPLPIVQSAARDQSGFRYPCLAITRFFHYHEVMKKMDAIAALGALAQDTRLDVFRLLVQAGAEGMAAGRIGERLGLPSATLSFHLNQLRHAGLVSFRRESRSLIYVAEYATMNRLLAYLTENCCRGDAAACAVSLCEPATASQEKAYAEPAREG